MMRLTIATLAILVGSLTATQAQAQHVYGWDSFWSGVGVDLKRMNHYPEPFIYADREATRHPFRIMVANGWRMQNTLGHHYFDPQTQQLTRAGEMRVRWIVTQAPQEHRSVHVQRTMDRDATATRMDSVQQAVARALPGQALPQVVETNTAPRGFPGAYVDDTLRQVRSSRPAPVLPAAGGGGQTN